MLTLIALASWDATMLGSTNSPVKLHPWGHQNLLDRSQLNCHSLLPSPVGQERESPKKPQKTKARLHTHTNPNKQNLTKFTKNTLHNKQKTPVVMEDSQDKKHLSCVTPLAWDSKYICILLVTGAVPALSNQGEQLPEGSSPSPLYMA